MAMSGPDSGYSWVIVLCSAYIHFALFGLFRSAGVMYVAVLQTYDVTREEASWSFSLCSAIFQLSGPLVSLLALYLSHRKVCLLGSFVATIGVAGCFFAKSVVWINVFYGVVHGFGFGMVVTLIPVFLNQYFIKYRATAIGIAFSGGTISSFIFPVVLEWLLESYGLNGTFLLLGGMVMNTMVASSLLKSPPWLSSQKTEQKSLPEVKDSGLFSSEVVEDLNIPADAVSCSSLKIRSDDCSGWDRNPANGMHSKSETENAETIYSNSDSLMFNGNRTKDVRSASVYSTIKTNEELRNVQEPLMKANHVFIKPSENKDLKYKGKKFKCHVPVPIVDILKQPMFHLITFTMSIYFLGLHSFFMVIVDFAKDKGIGESKGIYIISMFSLTDLIGRVGLGWVTDKNYIKRKNMVILNLIVIGILNQLYPACKALTGMLVISAIHGLSVGSSITLFFILQAEYLGMKRLTLAIGLANFITGALLLLRPSMIGLFRDVIGSYDWLFHFLGILSLIVSVIWLIESWIERNKNLSQCEDIKA